LVSTQISFGEEKKAALIKTTHIGLDFIRKQRGKKKEKKLLEDQIWRNK